MRVRGAFHASQSFSAFRERGRHPYYRAAIAELFEKPRCDGMQRIPEALLLLNRQRTRRAESGGFANRALDDRFVTGEHDSQGKVLQADLRRENRIQDLHGDRIEHAANHRSYALRSRWEGLQK